MTAVVGAQTALLVKTLHAQSTAANVVDQRRCQCGGRGGRYGGRLKHTPHRWTTGRVTCSLRGRHQSRGSRNKNTSMRK